MSDPLIRLLTETRRNRGITQQTVADAIGTGRPQVANLESGRSDITLSRLRAWCNILGLTLVVIPTALLDTQRDPS
jgi:transcriptional regulator with XRE-family HTH domain